MAVGALAVVGLALLLGLLLAASAVAIYDVQLLMQHGLSCRPVLWFGGVQLIDENTWFGLGFHEFKHSHNLFLDTGCGLGSPGVRLVVA